MGMGKYIFDYNRDNDGSGNMGATNQTSSFSFRNASTSTDFSSRVNINYGEADGENASTEARRKDKVGR
ncbi:cobyrinic acid A,C-diamide synthase [Paenibacillus sp. NAIST15-1]|nr:cobyrinic acid A,C-diamide synthase [Paenibacillus sp. NAIST15-1]